MNRKLLINTVLLVLVAGLGLFAWLEPGKQVETLERLTPRDPATVQSLRIERPDGLRIEFELRAGSWHMLRPYDLPANQVRVATLARVVEAPILSGFHLPTGNLAQFGLDRPTRLDLDQDQFLFGSSNPVSNQRYVGFGDRLNLIVDRFGHHLNATAEQLLNPGLLPEGTRLKEIKTPAYRLFKGENAWSLEPAVPDLSQDDLNQRVQDWLRAQALQILPVAQYESSGEVSLTREGGSTTRFLIVKKGEETWLVAPDLKLGYLLPAATELLLPPGSTKPGA